MGPYLGTPNKEKDSEDGENDQFKFGATSMQGWRKSQEDVHIAELNLPNGCALFGVFDGHGGKEVSLWVKDNFVPELLRLNEFKTQQYELALSTLFRRVDELLLTPQGQADLKKISETRGGNQGGLFEDEEKENVAQFTGCTATVVLVTRNDIICANAGDSRSVLARSRSETQVEDLSEDHKPDNFHEKQRIHAAGGFVEENRVNGSLNLSRSMGDFEYKSNPAKNYKEQMVTVDPEIKKVARRDDDDFLVLACDGIWDCLTSEECVAMMREHMKGLSSKDKLSTTIEDMFEKIIATDILQSSGMGTDNMTAIVVEIKRK